jgi:tRNA(Ile)-lysidine synthase
MLARFHTILQQFCKIDSSKLVLVGVSGGPDSLALLHILSRLDYPVLTAHLDHRLRPDSEIDLRFVEQAAASLGVGFVSGSEDVKAYADENVLSIEEAARILRYRFLFTHAAKNSAQAVMVGHTADDQVETVLMHLLRGSGLAGLQGMDYCSLPNPWSKDIPLVRPMLGVWREEIMAYCQENDLSPIEDLSNQDIVFYRNRIRRRLIPYLESYNPGVRRTVWRMSQALRGDNELLEKVVDVAWQECKIDQGTAYLAFSASRFSEQDKAVQRRLARRGFAILRPGLRDIDFEMVEAVINFLKQPSASRRSDLGAGLLISLEGDTLWLAGWEADLPAGDWPQLPQQASGCKNFPVRENEKLRINDDWVLVSVLVEPVEAALSTALANPDPFQAWLDHNVLEFPLDLRCRLSGERFKPVGMGGRSVKLSDLMINLKIPRRARRLWPILASSAEIAWIPGHRVGHRFRITHSTNKVLHLHLKREHIDTTGAS